MKSLTKYNKAHEYRKRAQQIRREAVQIKPMTPHEGFLPTVDSQPLSLSQYRFVIRDVLGRYITL